MIHVRMDLNFNTAKTTNIIITLQQTQTRNLISHNVMTQSEYKHQHGDAVEALISR